MGCIRLSVRGPFQSVKNIIATDVDEPRAARMCRLKEVLGGLHVRSPCLGSVRLTLIYVGLRRCVNNEFRPSLANVPQDGCTIG